MTIDVCSEISSPGISPRISFSYDLNQTTDVVQRVEDQDHTHHRLDSSLLDIDFHFSFHNSSRSIQELSSADELFSNGKILPIHTKKPSQGARLLPYHEARKKSDEHNVNPSFCREDVATSKKPSILSENNDHPISPVPSQSLLRTASADQATPEKKLLKEFLSMSLDEAEEKPTLSKSFWQFRRSISLNCDTTTKNKGLIRSLHFLSRSNSTGSAPNPPKQGLPMSSKEAQKPHLQKQPSVPSRRRSSVSGLVPFYPYNIASQKPPVLRKCGSYANGASVRVSPILNIPPSCISRGPVSLFGLGSFFCTSKVKKKRR